MNSFEYRSTETEQLETEKRDTQTVSQQPGPVSISVSIQEAVSAPVAEVKDKEVVEQPAPVETIKMESIPQISTELAFSCLLIPRFSDHYLTGDISKDLENWMKEICISYGWRMETVTIRPGYIQWGMTVPLTTNPAQCMKIIRQRTSQRIFEDYPRFGRKNVSPDFWAPGFSLVPGATPQSSEEINNFILQIRRQQGIF